MRLFEVGIVASLIFNSVTTSIKLWPNDPNRRRMSIYYDCGHNGFYKDFIQEAVIKRNWIIKPYQGPLYSESLNYRIVRIPNDIYQYSKSVFHVVINISNNVEGIITQMKNDYFIQCKPVDMSEPQQTHRDQREGNNFECGHKLFTHETIKYTADQAKPRIDENYKYTADETRSRINKNYNYPARYKGNENELEHDDYWINPVIEMDGLDEFKPFPQSTYHVLFTSNGYSVNVIAELIDGSFIDCTRTAKRPAKSLDSYGLFGYKCGDTFYRLLHLEKTAEFAESMYRPFKPHKYPEIYRDEQYPQAKWIYPLYPDGITFRNGQIPGNHFLVMDSSFDFVFPAMEDSGKLKPCRGRPSYPLAASLELEDFECLGTKFPNSHLKATVQEGCKDIASKYKRFHAVYSGPNFDVQGPYFTWPLFVYGFYTNSNSPRQRNISRNFRVVFNEKCQLAGVLVQIIGEDNFKKCKRVSGTIPGGFSNEEIDELSILEPVSPVLRPASHSSSKRRKILKDPST